MRTGPFDSTVELSPCIIRFNGGFSLNQFCTDATFASAEPGKPREVHMVAAHL